MSLVAVALKKQARQAVLIAGPRPADERLDEGRLVSHPDVLTVEVGLGRLGRLTGSWWQWDYLEVRLRRGCALHFDGALRHRHRRQAQRRGQSHCYQRECQLHNSIIADRRKGSKG